MCDYVTNMAKRFSEESGIKLNAVGSPYLPEAHWSKDDETPGRFAGTCASQNPMLNTEDEPCGFCGKTPEQFKDCDNSEM